MAELQLTPDALNQVQLLLEATEAKRPVIHVSWQPRQADNKRGPNGEAVWSTTAEAGWWVGVLDYEDPDLSDVVGKFPTIMVEGLEFSSRVFGPSGARLSAPLLDFDYEQGAFLVRDAAI